MFAIPISLIRYLFVLRVNHSLAWLSNYLPAELSFILGSTIAQRLPTAQARPWLKALSAWEPLGDFKGIASKETNGLPTTSWPIEAVIFAYPYDKRSFGEGEFILLELKLFGKSADHGLFLEMIMPAMEEIGFSCDKRWEYNNCLWGKFDIHAVYAARGENWEPFVENGQLDLNYHASPYQWSERLSYSVNPDFPPDTIRWLAPYDFEDPAFNSQAPNKYRRNRKTRKSDLPAPSLNKILEALIFRLNHLLAGHISNLDELWEILGEKQQAALKTAWRQASHISIYRKKLTFPPLHWPGIAMGSQTFTATFPEALIPLMGLAAMLHIGQYTHYGLGTFSTERRTD